MVTHSLQEVIEQQKGVLLVDKPSGITSHDVVNRVRRLTGVKRVGHAGTLDPLATGLLIILVGREYTKRQPEFLKQDKTYLVAGQLGVTTDSYDIDGQVVNQAEWSQVGLLSSSQILQLLPQFTGEIEQQVPAFSAVKVKGQKLYHQAHAGKTIDPATLPSRQVTVYSLDLLNFSKDIAEQKLEITLEASVSSGTYIRSLIHDLGQKLGVGATVTQLRRTQVGQLSVDDAISLPDKQK